ncbi:hypothetical protein WN944_005655 [Citrus x changshan-huyou]|uniref:Uncharacterized protein n=1 Tax=Citrus x changshan-huyou TaxID=2935761 RepID=A0AAP0MNZ6_9ROSI
MASSKDGDDDRPPSNPSSHAGDHHTQRPNLDLPSLPKNIHSKARPSSSNVPPENAIVLAISGNTSKLQKPSIPHLDTNRQPKTKKNQSKTKPSSRVSHLTTVVAATPTLTTLVDLKQQITISENQPSNELAMPKLTASGSGNTSPWPTHLRSAAEQVPAAIKDQPSFREPASDDLKQPSNSQLPETTLVATAENSNLVGFSSKLAATIDATAVGAMLLPSSTPPTSITQFQPLPPLTSNSTVAAREKQQPALILQTSQNSTANPCGSFNYNSSKTDIFGQRRAGCSFFGCGNSNNGGTIQIIPSR